MSNDDIVTRLHSSYFQMKHAGDVRTKNILDEAADEIERLRNLIKGVAEAVTNEGIMPSYHRKVMRKHRRQWPVLWSRIDDVLKEVGDE